MSAPRGPRLARWLASVLLPAADRDFVLGDLEELHRTRVRRHGRVKATLRYWIDACRSVVSRRLARAPWRGSGEGVARTLATDLGGAARTLVRHPRFTALATLTLALGIGASAAVFGMVNQLLLRPLAGTTEAEGQAYLHFRSMEDPDQPGVGISLPDVEAIRERATLLEGLASYGFFPRHASVGGGRPVEASTNVIYGDFFEVLGVRAVEGRLIRAAETAVGADARVVVISPALRRTLFGSEEAVGRTLDANGTSFTVIGVADGAFTGPERGDAMEMWMPYTAVIPAEMQRSREVVNHSDFVVRVREGADVDAAQAELTTILDRLARVPNASSERLASLEPVLASGLHVPAPWRAHTYASLRILAGAVGLVLLIACANVANLLLFRNVSRRGALATRRALGASSGRLGRERLMESLLLAASGAAGGLGVAWLITVPFRGEQLLRMPAFESFSVDARVLAFAGLAALVTAALFGAVPAALAGRFDLGAAMREAGGQKTGRLGRLRWLAASAQIGLSLTLVVGALLLARTVHGLYRVDTGFSIERVSRLSLDVGEWLEGEAADGLRRELLTAVGALPEVEGAALDLHGPHGSRMTGRIARADAPDDALRATLWPVTPEWFGLLEVDLVAGGPFSWDAVESGLPVPIVVTASLARRLFGLEEAGVGAAVGRRVRAGFGDRFDARIVGVAEDLASAAAPASPSDGLIVPFGTVSVPFVSLLVRTRSLDEGTLIRVRDAVATVVVDRPVPDPVPLADRVARIHSESRIFGKLLGLLAVLALGLAAVGLYGVVAFTVAGRVRELGIRIALGAGRGRIAALVLGSAARIIVCGVAAGLGGAYLLSAALESRLFGVERLDPVSYGGAAALFAVVAALACWSPARTAVSVNPVESLAAE